MSHINIHKQPKVKNYIKMDPQIMLPKNINVSKITFGVPKQLTGGARIVPLYYDGKPFIIQTARMTCSYGLSKWGEGVTAKYSIDGSFKNRDANASLQSFYDFLSELDKFMVEKGVENSVEWFKKKHTNTEVVAALYSHTLRLPKDKETGEVTDKYPPTFKMNLPVKDGKCTCKVYDHTKNLIDIMNGVNLKGATVTSLMKCTGVWLAGGNYGLTLKVEQLRVETPPDVLNTFAFQDEDGVCAPEDEDDDDYEHNNNNVKTNNTGGTHIDTSDDEDDVVPESTSKVQEQDDGIDQVQSQAPKKTPSKSKAASKK